ncbi:MAG: bifunctional hydroxymethylpyrimidine kinase/phosphomethylpyrimidine kinase [Candidatus Aminicenantes bacterium]|nr:bifunctional hydroxymethylpyrimidine kinase/phosphomethylpyrimidine kinase [Candidatus Aminicenantes bacterium]
MNTNKDRLLHLIKSFPGKRIAVWGDFILDEYTYGTTQRISREAPVLILSYKDTRFSLGGAGNSLLNLKSLGADPIPIGVLGTDEGGEKTLEILKQNNIPLDYIIREKKFTTPLKTRIFAGEETTRKQQILRIDRDNKVSDEDSLKQNILNNLLKLGQECHGLLISDYHYMNVKEDIFSKILPAFRKNNLPVMVDSRFRLLNFKEITISTPNEPEAEAALNLQFDDNDQIIKQAGTELRKKTRAEAVLITRGSKGMILFEKNRPPFLIPIHGTTQIVDMTGAGDTVISVIALCLACGSSYQEAALLANYAGGIVVMKEGTATVSPEELKEAASSGK